MKRIINMFFPYSIFILLLIINCSGNNSVDPSVHATAEEFFSEDQDYKTAKEAKILNCATVEFNDNVFTFSNLKSSTWLILEQNSTKTVNGKTSEYHVKFFITTDSFECIKTALAKDLN